MKLRPLQTFARLASFASVIVLTACTSVTKPNARSTRYLTDEKIHLNVAVNITDQLREGKWEQHAVLGGGMILSVGPALAEDAPKLARQTFFNAVEVSNGGTPPQPVDATLTPKMAFFGVELGQTMFSQDALTLKLEWTLTSPAGEVLWADTVTGVGRSKGGFAKDMTMAIEHALKKSHSAMLFSPAIRQYVAQKHPGEKSFALASMVTDPKVKELCAALNSTDRGVVMQSLQDLRKMNAPEAVPEILFCLVDNDANIVRDACRTLAVLGSKETVPYLEPLLKDNRSDVRKDAQNAISKLSAK